MTLAFALRRGIAYEGDGSFFRAVHPIPVITRATFEGLPSVSDVYGWPYAIFREDSFDPSTRVRRGRLYCRDSPSTTTLPEAQVHNYPFGPHIGAGAGWTSDCSYRPFRGGQSDLKLDGRQIDLGDPPRVSQWRVVTVEQISTGETLLTLRAMSTLGQLPVLKGELFGKDGNNVSAHAVHEAIDRLVSVFYVQQPTPIVDVARETARVILTEWMGQNARGLDLGRVIKAIPESFKMLTWAASMVNWLHPRGKSSQREMSVANGAPLRLLVDEDAEVSIQLVGMILREVDWTRT